jgi:hypothetical protein
VEWLVTGGDVASICGGKISGGVRLCTENTDMCAAKTHVEVKADLKPNWLYDLKSSDSRSMHNTASLALGTPIDIFGGRMDELESTTIKVI